MVFQKSSSPPVSRGASAPAPTRCIRRHTTCGAPACHRPIRDGTAVAVARLLPQAHGSYRECVFLTFSSPIGTFLLLGLSKSMMCDCTRERHRQLIHSCIHSLPCVCDHDAGLEAAPRACLAAAAADAAHAVIKRSRSKQIIHVFFRFFCCPLMLIKPPMRARRQR